MLAAIILMLLGVAVPAHAVGQHWTALGPEGGEVDVVASDPTNPLVIYAGNLGGVQKSTDGGATWSDASSGLERRPGIWTISIDPSNPSRLVAGGIFMAAGIHTSADGGAHWVEADFGLPAGGKTDTFSIARDPGAPQTVYATLTDGIVKSVNGGSSWAMVGGGGLTCTNCAGAIVVDEGSPGVIYLDAGYADGLQKSLDGGGTFQPVGPGLPAGFRAFALAVHAGTLYAGFYQEGIYRSTDGGGTFGPVNVGLPANPVVESLAIDPTTPSRVYALVATIGVAYSEAVYASTDGGDSWGVKPIPGGAAAYGSHALTVDAAGCVVVGSLGAGVWRSCTGGASWTNGTAGFRGVLASALATSPTTAGTAYLASGSGVFKTTDTGTTWVRTAYPEPSASVVALAPSNPEVVYALGGPGAHSTDGGATWTPCGSPNLLPPVIPFTLVVDPSNPDTVYVGYYGNDFLKSTDGCGSWMGIHNGISSGVDGRALAIDPTNPQTLFGAASFGGLYKSTDGGASWARIASGTLNYSFLVAIAPSDPSVMYAIDNGFVYRSLDAGASWSPKFVGLPPEGAEYSNLIVDPQHPLRVALSGSSQFGVDGGVWLTPDGGDHWHEITGDLHDWDVVSLALDRNGEMLLAGTEGSGVHRVNTRCTLDADCFDTNECTADSCNPFDPTSDGFGCVHFQADPLCVDHCDSAAECQSADLCEVWACVPGDPGADVRGCLLDSFVSCPDPDACHDAQCDSNTGQCVVTPRTGNPCDDGEPCTYLDRCQAGACVGSQEPVASCKTPTTPRASLLTIRDSPLDAKDKLAFTFRKGPLANAGDFGNPFNVGGTGYLVCLYDHSGPGGSSKLRSSAVVPPGGGCGARPCWSPTRTGFRYRDRSALGDGGVDTLDLVPGDAAKITLKAHGVGMDVPAGPLASAVTLQIRRTDTSSFCWGASFSGFVKKNDLQGFKARSD